MVGIISSFFSCSKEFSEESAWFFIPGVGKKSITTKHIEQQYCVEANTYKTKIILKKPSIKAVQVI